MLLRLRELVTNDKYCGSVVDNNGAHHYILKIASRNKM